MYWENTGPENTCQTIKLAVEKARELGIDHFVVASNTGTTVLKLLQYPVKHIVCLTQVGFKNPGEGSWV